MMLALSASFVCAKPAPMDFAYSIPLKTTGEGAIFRVSIPDSVYETVIDPSLGDMRVFNGDDQVVPHTLLTPEAKTEAGDVKPRYDEKQAPIFPVNSPDEDDGDALFIRVETDGKGAVLNVEGGKKMPAGRNVLVYIVDLSALEEKPSALKIEWADDNNDFIVKADVFTSDDLSHWTGAAFNATLADISFGGRRLVRDVIHLKGQCRDYLKLRMEEKGRAVHVNKVKALILKNPPSPDLAELRRSLQVHGREGDPGEYLFQASGFFPVDSLEVVLPENNTLVQAKIFNRVSPEKPWRLKYEGLLYDLVFDGARLANETVRFRQTSGPFWRLVIDSGGGGLGGGDPVFNLSYMPHDLCFVARGREPFTIAYGSRITPQGSAPVDPLLAGLSADKKTQLIKEARTGRPFELAGGKALKEVEPPLPWARIVLWLILVAGAAAVGVMAWKLYCQMGPKSG